MPNDDTLNGFTGFNRSDAAPRRGAGVDVAPGQAFPSAEFIAAADAIDAQGRRWAWIEVDRSAIRHNVAQAKRHMKPSCRLMAVVKADGYGHGAVECAKVALSVGASYLGVATVDEGVQLRQAGIDAPILVLAEPPATSIPLLLAHNIMPAVYTPEFAMALGEAADAQGMQAHYHLAVNTGMNRIGVRAEDVLEFERQVNFHRALVKEGMFTHFATSDMPENIDFRIQVNRFEEAVRTLRAAGVNPGIVHAANSAAIFRFPEVHYDMCRLGISLYGYHACRETVGKVPLRPAMSVYARITNVNSVPMGEGVSYGLNYRSSGSVKICTIPLGYADGLRRGLSGRGNVIYDGQYCRQVGNICMDQCMFEVDLRSYASRKRLDPQIGDKVTVVGREGDAAVTISEMAYELGTIEHEVAIGFSHRLPRFFV